MQKKTIRIGQFEFDGGVQRINVVSEFKQFWPTLSPKVEKVISIYLLQSNGFKLPSSLAFSSIMPIATSA